MESVPGTIVHVGAAQGDMAALCAENIDAEHRVIKFARQKTRSLTVQRFGDDVAAILNRLPKSGLLFPKLSQHTSSNRAARFGKAAGFAAEAGRIVSRRRA